MNHPTEFPVDSSLVYPPESDGSPLSPWELELNCFEYYKQLFGMILSDLHLIKTLISSGQSSFSLLKHSKFPATCFSHGMAFGKHQIQWWWTTGFEKAIRSASSASLRLAASFRSSSAWSSRRLWCSASRAFNMDWSSWPWDPWEIHGTDRTHWFQ